MLTFLQNLYLQPSFEAEKQNYETENIFLLNFVIDCIIAIKKNKTNLVNFFLQPTNTHEHGPSIYAVLCVGSRKIACGRVDRC